MRGGEGSGDVRMVGEGGVVTVSVLVAGGGRWWCVCDGLCCRRLRALWSADRRCCSRWLAASSFGPVQVLVVGEAPSRQIP